ncbi:MAG: glycosyltransferase [Gemmatimonadaceae bacterium]|nr:glycosyltransferase [Gemmatimonadaceae bacterium]MCW5825413.1 glycosyltransferase [Gemmatimonadaceae bacterium]
MIELSLALGSIGWISYCVFIYPIIVSIAGRMRPVEVRADSLYMPKVTLIVTARNEEASVLQKLRNALASEYPADRLRVLLVSDGSTDRTVELANELKSLNGERLDILPFAGSRGKTAALMDGIERVRHSSDVIVISDANSIFAPDAVARLVANFADERVGCVAGELRYQSKTGEKAYRGVENKLREMESRIGVSVGAEGAIYAVRAADVPTIRGDLIDDFTIPLLIQSRGRLVAYESLAVANEEFFLDWRQQYARRRRIVNRCIRSSVVVPGLYNPFRTPLASFAFISHRLMRWTIAVPLLTLLVVAALQVTSAYPWNLIAVTPAMFAGWVALGTLLRDQSGVPRVLSMGLFGTLAVTAMAHGVFSAVRGERVVQWKPQRS